MRLLILADIDDTHWSGASGQADIVLSCGDVSDNVILEAATAYTCSTIFTVKGNHDSPMPFKEPIKGLHLQVHEYEGITFGGLNGSWKYKLRGHFLYEQWEVDTFLASFPHVDILLSHNSPRGIHDRDDDIHTGFDGLRSYILQKQPHLLIHGHQHVNIETRLKKTRIIGVYGHTMLEI